MVLRPVQNFTCVLRIDNFVESGGDCKTNIAFPFSNRYLHTDKIGTSRPIERDVQPIFVPDQKLKSMFTINDRSS